MLPTNCENLTDKSLSNITFTDNDIGKTIRGLDPNKAHSHGMDKHSYAKTLGRVYLQTFTTDLRSLVRSKDFPLVLEKSQHCPYS